MVLGSVPGVWASGLETEGPSPPVAGCPTKDCKEINKNIHRCSFFNALHTGMRDTVV